jgi:hypothetical protein
MNHCHQFFKQAVPAVALLGFTCVWSDVLFAQSPPIVIAPNGTITTEYRVSGTTTNAELLRLGSLLLGPDAPKIPKPNSYLEVLPVFSEVSFVSVHQSDMYLYYPNEDNQMYGHGVYHPIAYKCPLENLTPPFPADTKLAYKLYWKKIDQRIIPPNAGFEQKYTVRHGVTTNDSQTFGAELGVKAGALSAKLTETTTHSIQIVDEDTMETDYSLPALADKIQVWSVWQLVEEFAWVDSNRVEINYNGGCIFDAAILPASRLIHGTIVTYPDHVPFVLP